MLADELRARIEREGPLRARDFLEAALRAYYAAAPAIGAEGDFYTASNVGLFPHALDRFVEGALQRLGAGRVVELGAGRGHVSQHLARRWSVTVVEPSPGLAEAQRAKGLRVVASLAELKPAPTVFLANEVLDALPVHRVLSTPEGPREAYVVVGPDGRFREQPGPLSDPRLALALPEGCAAEVCLDADPLLAAMAEAAPQAVALFLDYGGRGDEVRGEARPQGTLRGYHRHQVTDPYERPGEQDVTADVDFARVEEAASAHGFAPAGYAPQGEFLADLGLVDDMMAALQRGDMEAYLAAKGLLMPGGMGERFKALALVRGVPPLPPLAGFRKDIFPGASRR